MLRDKTGKFKKGNKGFWMGKKRPSMQGERNWRWVGGDTIKHCLLCGKDFPTRGKRRETGKFCSQSCLAKWKFTGEKNPRWNGDVPREKREQLPEYRKWRQDVMRKDFWTCRICKYKGKKIVAHHIRIFKAFPELRFKVENGIVLCIKCHNRLHSTHRNVIDFREILRDYMSDTER